MADSSESGGSQWTTERFQEWLEQTASNEDRTKQEVLHRMMASFWVLNEFEDLVGPEKDPGFKHLEQELDLLDEDGDDPWSMLPDQARTGDQDTVTDDSDPEMVRGLIEGFASYLDEHGPDNTEPAGDRESTDTDRQADTEDAAQQPGRNRAQRPTNPQSTDPTRPSISQPGHPTTKPPIRDPIAARIDALEDTLESIETRQETIAEDLDGVIDSHIALADTVDDLVERNEELDDAHESLDERVETDMSKVEQILKRLTEKYKDADESLDQVESTLMSVLEERRMTERQREQLASLLQTAHAHGIEAGACEDCQSKIRLGLLTTPRCPHCSKQLVDVRPGGWFRSDIIETADTQRNPRSTVRQLDNPQRPVTHQNHPQQNQPHQNQTSDQNQRGTPQDQRGTPQDQRGTPQDQRGTPQDQSSTSQDDLDAVLRPDDDDSDASTSFEWTEE